MKQEINDALTVIKFRIEENEKINRPLKELANALTVAIQAEDVVANAPKLIAAESEKTKQAMEGFRRTTDEAQKEADAIVASTKSRIAEANRKAETAENDATHRINEAIRSRDSLKAQYDAEIDELRLILGQLKEERGGLLKEIGDLTQSRAAIKQQLSEMLKS